MIEIDPDTKKIFFYYTPDEIIDKRWLDEDMIELELLSGQSCPDCKCVLSAYYVGTLPIKAKVGYSNYHPYMPSKSNAYSISQPQYKYGQEYGGGFLRLYNHNQTLCQTYISDKEGVVEGIKDFVDPENEGKITEEKTKIFAEKVLSDNIPGVYIIKDVCGKRPPVLAINRKVFCENINYKDYNQQRKEYDYGKLFKCLVDGDPEIKLPNSTEPVFSTLRIKKCEKSELMKMFEDKLNNKWDSASGLEVTDDNYFTFTDADKYLSNTCIAMGNAIAVTVGNYWYIGAYLAE